MNERELGKAMLRRDSDVDAKAIADRVMRRDRRRMWTMTVGCVAAWMFVVMLAWGFILPMLAKVAETQKYANDSSSLSAADKERVVSMLVAVKGGAMATFLGSIVSTLLAAIITVRLITFSRTSTLRQVNARLDEISAQLKLLASALPK